MSDTYAMLPALRTVSRDLVRSWGFLNRTIANTDLAPSAVHAIIEIGRQDGITAADLSARLHLEKSTVSRLLSGLAKRNLIADAPDPNDGRAKRLHLTDAGRATLSGVDSWADAQVCAALDRLTHDEQIRALDGLTTYADALRDVAATDPATETPKIARGYHPGLLGMVSSLVSSFMIEAGYPFDHAFECKVAADMAAFLPRADATQNGIWHAWSGATFLGSVTIDGDNLGPGVAHLRWFFVTDAARGTGVGRALLDHALAHVDNQGFSETQLWTAKGLDAARRLYERNGFVLAEQWTGDQWGAPITEQRFVRSKPA